MHRARFRVHGVRRAVREPGMQVREPQPVKVRQATRMAGARASWADQAAVILRSRPLREGNTPAEVQTAAAAHGELARGVREPPVLRAEAAGDNGVSPWALVSVRAPGWGIYIVSG
jgi:hypothetical protein